MVSVGSPSEPLGMRKCARFSEKTGTTCEAVFLTGAEYPLEKAHALTEAYKVVLEQPRFVHR
jgi:hypothetical protein